MNADRQESTSIEAIISDLGNVLAWFDRSIAYRALGRHVGMSPLRIAELMDGTPLRKQFEVGAFTEEEFYRRVITLLGCDGAIEFSEFAHLWGDMFTTNRKMVKTLVECKSRGIRLVLLSNTNSIHIAHIERNHPEIIDLFDGRLIYSHRVGAAKPDRRIYDAALAHADAPPERCLYIDDLPEYVAAAESLGMIGHIYTNHPAFLPKLGKLATPSR